MPTTILDTMLRHTRRVGDFPYPHWAAVFLNNPVRRFLGRPGAVVDAVGLTGAERVLEIGPGPGYFSAELATRLTAGHLDLFDLQPEMLAKARRRLDAIGCSNVAFTAGDAGGELPYASWSFDVAFLAAVIGEVPDKAACIRALATVVKPGRRAGLRGVLPRPGPAEPA